MNTDKTLFGIGAHLRAQNGVDGHVMFIAVGDKLGCAGLREIMSAYIFVPEAGAQRSSVPICRGGPPE